MKLVVCIRFDIVTVINTEQIGDENLVQNLKEKDLLTRSKEVLWASNVKKILRHVYRVSIGLPVIFLVLGIIVMWAANLPKYPYLEIQVNHVLMLVYVALPMLAGAWGLQSLERAKHYTARLIGSILVQAFLIFFSLLSAVILFMIMPPIESMTKDVDNYLVVDSDVERFRPVYEAFFPSSVPEHSDKVSYMYKCQNGLLSQEITIKASWQLPQDEYIASKEIMKQEHKVEEQSDHNWKVTLKGVRYPEKANLNMIYDDETHTITYLFTVDKNI